MVEKEQSVLSKGYINATPTELMCALCKKGGAEKVYADAVKVAEIIEYAQKTPNNFVNIVTSFDSAGAKNERFYQSTPLERRRDLEILHSSALTPNCLKTIRIFYDIVKFKINNICDICGCDSHNRCPNVDKDYYKLGLETIVSKRTAADMAEYKCSSCSEIDKSDKLHVRAHHMLCMTCFIGGHDEDLPIAEDNLYEVWDKIRNNPDIELILVESTSRCAVCKPCYSYDTESGLCAAPMALKDRKRDLDVFAALNIDPETVHTAREILTLICEKIPNVEGICTFKDERYNIYEWRSCLSPAAYTRGLEKIKQLLDIEV